MCTQNHKEISKRTAFASDTGITVYRSVSNILCNVKYTEPSQAQNLLQNLEAL